MKGAFETFLIFLLGMTFVLLGFSMVQVILSYNNARLYQESIITLIERHNRFDDDVIELIDLSKQGCQSCEYSVDLDETKYLVTVNFDVMIMVLNYAKRAELKAYTQSLH